MSGCKKELENKLELKTTMVGTEANDESEAKIPRMHFHKQETGLGNTDVSLSFFLHFLKIKNCGINEVIKMSKEL